MSAEQPEALRLAEKMESYKLCSGYAWHCHKAAAELRRLHSVNADLLEALQSAERAMSHPQHSFEVLDKGSVVREMIRAAIAKATGAA